MNEAPRATNSPPARVRLPADPSPQTTAAQIAGQDWPFWAALAVIASCDALLIAGMLLADARFTTGHDFLHALSQPEIQYSIRLTLFSATFAAALSVCVSVPVGYLLSRARFPGRRLLDALLDVPIVLPPLVVGMSLLILFQTPVGRLVENHVRFTYAVPGLILAQFVVACAFAIRAMRSTFDHIPERPEQVALTLGCSRAGAFWRIAVPSARRGVLTAFTLAWARAMGEFGPVLVFAGVTRFKTEVLPTTVFLELSAGNLQAAVAVSLLLAFAAIALLIIIRLGGEVV